MNEVLDPKAAIENPQTLREVGIHLGNLSKTLEQNAAIEKTHHAENLESNKMIIKKLEEMQEAYPTRSEFKEFKDVVMVAIEKKADKWVEKTLVFVGATIGLAIIGAIMAIVLIKPN